MANRLAREKSPYLLQHAENPVDWHTWGEEAFAKAEAEDKPVFLSIGYATCHWCHVMAHESFEDEAVAEKLNRDFVSVKVDREERPDVDHIYMTVCQALTGSGGWPLSLFLTPDKKPFFAGTYFPPSGQMGQPGFGSLLDEIARLWKEDRKRLLEAGDKIISAIRPKPAAGQSQLDETTLEKAYWTLDRSFDEKRGGFGQAPKFPTPHQLTFLLRWHLRHPRSRALAMVEKTLTAMRHGGIFDQVGLGFHRYSVDQRWLAPHFEKMLYDQALLALAYLEAFQLTKKEVFAQAAREIFTYVLRDMTSPQGGFYSAEDADSEGVEGLFYVWTPDQVKDVLGDKLGGLFCRFHDITGPGNFEHGRSIPWITRDMETFARQQNLEPEQVRRDLAQAKKKLFAARQKRVPPLKDDKVLAAWNGLMIAALAKGHQVLGDDKYLDAADKAADFVLSELGDGKGGLWRRWREGEKKNPGYLDDYAFMVWGLIELYEAGCDARRLGQATALQQRMLELFWDEMHHGFYYTPVDGEDLIVRSKEIYDGATPSGNSVSAINLLRLARLLGRGEWEEKAWQLMRAFSEQVAGHPAGFTQFLQALDFALGPAGEVVLAGEMRDENTQEMLRIIQRDFAPGRVWLLRPEGEAGREVARLAPFCRDMRPVDGAPAAYVCQNHACQRPLTGPAELAKALTGDD